MNMKENDQNNEKKKKKRIPEKTDKKLHFKKRKYKQHLKLLKCTVWISVSSETWFMKIPSVFFHICHYNSPELECVHMLWRSTTPLLQQRFRYLARVTKGFPQPLHQCFMTPATNDRLTVGSVVGSTGQRWGTAGETERERENRKMQSNSLDRKKRVWFGKGHCKDDTGMFALRISSWAWSLSAGGHTISFHKTIMHHFCLFIYLSIYLFNQFVLILTVSACHGRVPPELIDRLIVINMLRYEWWGESLHRNTSTQFCLRWNIHLASSKCYIVGNWTCLNLSEFSFFFFFFYFSPLIQGASSVLTNWRGVAGF